ncbi:MAG: ribonuclease Y [Phycisphaerales bacterium]|nr:MAG: ribonuclease Y [Phycisphaerales bacterium]
MRHDTVRTLAQAGEAAAGGGVPIWAVILIAVLALVAGFGIARLLVGKTLTQARSEAGSMVDKARQEASAEAERVRLEAERQALERKTEVDKDIDRARGEIREQEKRLAKREDAFDRKEQSLEQKESTLARRESELDEQQADVRVREAELDRLHEEQTHLLHRIADLTPEQAKEELLSRVEDSSRSEIAKLVRRITEKAEEEAEERAREITLMAIQRYATEHTSEHTVRTVAIPSDDMKGRIIGREGRNIRAIEKATGADIIVDDTPGVIVVSCFDKIRQTVAVESLERLIADGRMHPTRIEEIVEKVRSEVDQKVIKAGKDAVLEANLAKVHPKISEAMGKLFYRTSYGQNVLRHSIEVGYLCQLIAEQLGLDGKLARRCGFLHDIGKAMDHEMEGGHPKIGMDFAKQFGERDEVLNAIGGHHADIPSTSFYTPIVMAADAVSSARPGARRESMERYVQRLNELQDIALAQPGVREAYAVQAGREVRVMIDADRVGDDEAYLIAHEIARRVSDEMTFPGEIKVTVLRETRAIEIAR